MRISDALRSWMLALSAVVALATAPTGPVQAFEGRPSNDMRSPLDAFRAGARALRDGRTEDAVTALQFAANNGHAASAWKLGQMYRDGEGVRQDDLRAFETFRRITLSRGEENPNSHDARFISSAFVALGRYWLEGIPNTYVRANPQRAYELFFHAASNFGDADGQYNVGRLLLEGQGTPRDPRQATRWLSLAAAKSHAKAQAVLGQMLFTGRDVPRQAPRGLMFLTLAKEGASDEDTWITTMYDEAMQTATDDERAVALRMVEQWLRSNRR